MIVARIIVCVVLSIVLVGAMYGAFEGIRIKDDRLANVFYSIRINRIANWILYC